MNAIVVKTAKRDTTVTRLEVRRAVSEAYNKKEAQTITKSDKKASSKKTAKQH